jgi:hypothetical protein
VKERREMAVAWGVGTTAVSFLRAKRLYDRDPVAR